MNLPPGYVAHLPPPQGLPPRAHLFDAAIDIAADKSASGYAQKEKTCRNCGAVRVTVFSPDVYEMRAWRRSGDGPQITTDIAPPCNSESPWPR